MAAPAGGAGGGAPDVLRAGLNLMLRLPPRDVHTNLSGLTVLQPDLTGGCSWRGSRAHCGVPSPPPQYPRDVALGFLRALTHPPPRVATAPPLLHVCHDLAEEFLQRVDQPLKAMVDPTTKRKCVGWGGGGEAMLPRQLPYRCRCVVDVFVHALAVRCTTTATTRTLAVAAVWRCTCAPHPCAAPAHAQVPAVRLQPRWRQLPVSVPVERGCGLRSAAPRLYAQVALVQRLLPAHPRGGGRGLPAAARTASP
jgi:hypothetical protein